MSVAPSGASRTGENCKRSRSQACVIRPETRLNAEDAELSRWTPRISRASRFIFPRPPRCLCDLCVKSCDAGYLSCTGSIPDSRNRREYEAGFEATERAVVQGERAAVEPGDVAHDGETESGTRHSFVKSFAALAH